MSMTWSFGLLFTFRFKSTPFCSNKKLDDLEGLILEQFYDSTTLEKLKNQILFTFYVVKRPKTTCFFVEGLL